MRIRFLPEKKCYQRTHDIGDDFFLCPAIQFWAFSGFRTFSGDSTPSLILRFNPCFMGLMVFFPPRVVVTSPQLLVAFEPWFNHHFWSFKPPFWWSNIPELLPKLHVAPSQPWSIVQSACLVMVNPGFYQTGAPVDVPFTQFWDSSCTKKVRFGVSPQKKLQMDNLMVPPQLH